jgi:hypothetical protein
MYLRSSEFVTVCFSSFHIRGFRGFGRGFGRHLEERRKLRLEEPVESRKEID